MIHFYFSHYQMKVYKITLSNVSDNSIVYCIKGLITDKDLLPIIGLHFGQAVDNTNILDKFKLGRFNCSGHQQHQHSPSNNNQNNYGIMPTNCDQLRSLGHRLNGFYTVKSPSNDKRLNTVYCDFTNQQQSIAMLQLPN